MANPEHLEILKQGVEVWNRWRIQNPTVQPYLRGPYLNKAELSGAILNTSNLMGANLKNTNLAGAEIRRGNLVGAYLTAANLKQATLENVDLREATCIGAKLNGANLQTADLRDANFEWANLSSTYLTKANLSGAYFGWADLSQAVVGQTTFGDLDLSNTKGLASLRHTGPSHLDIHTLYRSEGKIPDIFLRGIGIPEVFIEYLPSLLNQPVQFYSCFISYSSKDEIFVKRLHADLQQKGVRCWFAPEDMKIGDKIRPIIDQSIRVHDKLLLILSENSLNSFWVESEVERAFEEERRRKQTVLFPVRLDEAVMETNQPWATEIRRTRHIGDFSKWTNHDAYQQAFERLLRDLKAETGQ